MSRLGQTFRGPRLRELLVGGAHLGALWAFAFAWPLLDLLGKNPDFFVARSNTAGDIFIFALCFMLLPPLALLALEALVAVFSRTAYRVLHLVLVGAMAAVFFVQIEKRIFTSPTALIILIALACGAALAYGLLRTRFVPSLLDVLSVAPVVFLVIFFFFSDTSKLILPQSNASALGVRVPSKTPVVEVIFDEFPTATLLDRRGRIDARRFPHFAALARQATWYPNNTTVADFTGRAVPAIMTGNNPSGSTLPIASDQPNSIFSLLGGAYRLHVKEVVTQVCAASLCGEVQRPRQLSRLKSLVDDLRYVEGRIILPPSMANELPNVSTTFGNFGNNGGGAGDKGAGRFAQDLFTPPSPGEFEHFLNRIPRGNRTLSLIHMELPHEPWRYLPSGQNYLDTSVSDLGTRERSTLGGRQRRDRLGRSAPLHPDGLRRPSGRVDDGEAEEARHLEAGDGDRHRRSRDLVQGRDRLPADRRAGQPRRGLQPAAVHQVPGSDEGGDVADPLEVDRHRPDYRPAARDREPLQDPGGADQRGRPRRGGRRDQRPGRGDQDAALARPAPAQRRGQAGLLPARRWRPIPPRPGSGADRDRRPAALGRDPARDLGHGRERRRPRARQPRRAGGPGLHRRASSTG